MCLSKLENFKVTQNYGWQVFSKDSPNMLYPCFFGSRPVPIGKWQKDKFRILKRWIYTDISALIKYRKGYHIFLNEEDAKTFRLNLARDYCIRKVRFKKVLVKGFQKIVSGALLTRWAKVIVCRKRFVESEL